MATCFFPYAVLMSLLNLRKVDIVILGDGVCAPVGWALKRVSKKPVVCVLHGLDITWQNTLYQAFWVKFFLNNLIVLSPLAAPPKNLHYTLAFQKKKLLLFPTVWNLQI
jgi:hypothetical protein